MADPDATSRVRVPSNPVTAEAGAHANGNKTDYYSNNPLFECLVCSRQVSSNRYATHLEKCMGMGLKTARKGSARNAKSSSSAATSRLLNSTPGPDSPSMRSANLSKKRAASPNALRPSGEEKQAKTERVSTPSSTAQNTPKLGLNVLPSSRQGTPASTATPDENKPLAKLQREASTTAPSSTAGDTTVRTEDMDSDDAEFPDGFSVSSDSDESGSQAGLSDAEGGVAHDDTVDDVEFDLDEVEEASDNEGEVDIDAELEDSDDNDDNDDV